MDFTIYVEVKCVTITMDRDMEEYQSEVLKQMCSDIILFEGRP